ncbi:MAG: glycosyltransferase family 2 protein [Gammaproteobacteria bacterium]|nr:glycosyltransferase family 2 protein [Gammaproteobacteria bacterium]
MSFKPCIIIPVYNHAQMLPAVLDRLAHLHLPCLVVNDGSSTLCSALLQKIAQEYSWLTLLEHTVNQGKGAAVMTGIRAAAEYGYTHALQVDADGQHAIEDATALLKMAESNPSALISGRPVYDESVPKHRLYARYLTHVLVWLNTLSLEIKDSMCGFRVYPISATLRLINEVRLGARMDFDTEVMVRLYWRNTSILQIPSRVIYPEDGQSHFNLINDNALITALHTRLFFGMLLRLPFLLMRLIKRFITRRVQRKHQQWHQLQERGSLLGMRLLLAVHRLLGARGFQIAIAPALIHYFIFHPTARRSSHQYLTHFYAAFPQALKNKKPNYLSTLQHFNQFTHVALDKIITWVGHYREHNVTFEDREVLSDLVRRKQGALIIGSHLGNIEISRALSQTNPDAVINVLMHTKHNPKFNHLLRETPQARRINLIQVTDIGADTAMMLNECINRGEMIILTGDRVPVQSAERVSLVNFLNKPAPLPQGPYILASLLKCPVLVLFCLKEKNRYRIYLEPFADVIQLPRKDRETHLQHYAQRYAHVLEKYCQLAPLQWFNFYDFWHTTKITPPPKEQAS